VEFDYRYPGASNVSESASGSALSFAPDLLRPPTSFRGVVRDARGFREAMSALHDVVVADLRFKPKDRTKYLAWRAQQDDVDVEQVARDRLANAREMEQLRAELSLAEGKAYAGRKAFFDARARYYKYLYERDRELWFKLDPVISVHPDQVFFECFSRDESSYGRLSARYEGFDELSERACGTTNVDYSDGLYAEFQKLRSYKRTSLDVDPSGFSVATSGDQHKEVKIDVPESWVRGFLQVSSAMTLPGTVVDLHPMDIHNVCLVLRRNRELFGPRSLRYRLRPGGPVVIVVEPWGIEVRCPRSIFKGDKAQEVRVWGRRRLHVLERLLPQAQKVRVHLLGTGQPSFYVVDLGPLSFTLGLSGWTKNDWAAASNFDLMAAREDVDDATRQRVFAELGKVWLATPAALASSLGLTEAVTASALGGWVQAGRAVYDLESGVYRKRELSREPLPVAALRFASEREEKAAKLLHQGKISIDEVTESDGRQRVLGRILFKSKVTPAWYVLDADRRLVEGECACDYFIRNRLHRGPCDHLLALRAAQRRGISDTIEVSESKPAARPKGTPARSAQPARAQPARGNPRAEPALVRQPSRPTSSLSAWDRFIWLLRRFLALFFEGGALSTLPERARLSRALQHLRGELIVSDKDALLDELVEVYGQNAAANARLFALVAAIKASGTVSRTPPDQTLIDALRRELP
jgi:predicted nucleic acid-binding Zn finger protein